MELNTFWVHRQACFSAVIVMFPQVSVALVKLSQLGVTLIGLPATHLTGPIESASAGRAAHAADITRIAANIEFEI